MPILHLELTFQVCSLDICYLGLLFSSPSSLWIHTVANKQGGVRGESVNSVNRVGDSLANDVILIKCGTLPPKTTWLMYAPKPCLDRPWSSLVNRSVQLADSAVALGDLTIAAVLIEGTVESRCYLGNQTQQLLRGSQLWKEQVANVRPCVLGHPPCWDRCGVLSL
jgi:hypothetical protein